MNFSVLNLLLYLISASLLAFGCLFLCYLLYLHYIHTINAHLPGPPRSSFILGNLADYWQYEKATGRNLTEYLLEKRLEYGPIFVMTFFHRCVVYLGDPNYVREVFIEESKYACKPSFIYDKMGFIFGERGMGYGLVTNIDEFSWHKRRQIMNPAFHRSCLRNFIMNFNDVSNRFLNHMSKVADSGEPVSMVKEFTKLTLDAINQVSFNINTNTIEDPESPLLHAIRNYFKGMQANFEIPLHPTLLAVFQYKLFQTHSQGVQINATRFLRKFASDCITARMMDIAENKDVPNDLLNILVNDGSLTKDDIIDEFITIVMAGHETTGNSLAFLVYEILSNPHVEAKLLNEIKEVLGGRQEVEFNDLPRLKYIGQVLEENLRKHPVAQAPTRVLEKEITVGGYRILKGNGVSTNSLMFGMNPEMWKDPEVFDPERFADAGNIPNLGMIHFPFSIGPRNCIGQTFAKFESKLVLAKLFQKFKLELLPDQTDRLSGWAVMRPRDGMMCKVSRRF